MALSNWDTIAFNEDGQCVTGNFTHPKTEVGLDLYKNWLYIRSEKMWTEGGSFVADTIAQLDSGYLNIGGWNISAIRGSQNSIFLLASYSFEDEQGKYSNRYVGGISGYDYKDKILEVLKSLNRENEYNDDWCQCSSSQNEDYIYSIKNFTTNEEIIYHRESVDGKYDYEKGWTGILNSTIDEYLAWVEEMCDEYSKPLNEWLDKVKSAQKLRYNQGDAYFANHLGDSLPASEPEKTDVPIIHNMIKSIK